MRAVTTRYIYHGQLTPVASVTGSVVSFYLYGPGSASPLGMIRDGVNYTFVSDVRGSIRAVIDSGTG